MEVTEWNSPTSKSMKVRKTKKIMEQQLAPIENLRKGFGA